MRTLIAAGLFIAATCALRTGVSPGQQPGQDKKADQKKFDPPKAAKPDDDTLKQITDKTAKLREEIAAFRATNGEKKLPDAFQGGRAAIEDVEVFLKAAEWIVRHGEWFAANSGKQ
ncbi:MAG TPA: hypothetical protein VKE74_15670, partial [Gemmataceae bacterium]|nr:hypothetical protein [Gemmataceae bacterium]